MRVLSPAKKELWIALLLVVWLIIHGAHRPTRPEDTIASYIVIPFAWVLTLNASLDFKRMRWWERIVLIFWFPLITWGMFALLHEGYETLFEIHRWADR